MAPLQDLQFPTRGDDDDGDTGRKSIFMNQKSMANNDVFARLAAITAAAPDPDGENADEPVIVSPTRSSRIRTHSHGYGDSGYATPSLGGSVPGALENDQGNGKGWIWVTEIDERQRAFNLLDENDLLFSSSHRIIPHESDAAKEQANATFSTMLSRELADDDLDELSSRPSSP
ncbi:4914_t:CDS:2, partial [Acaulospora colombiana]